jgi:hypothetical protein
VTEGDEAERSEGQTGCEPISSMISSFGCTSSFSFSSRRFSLCARVRLAIRPDAVMNAVR